jgi:restriction endonuclease-like protein
MRPEPHDTRPDHADGCGTRRAWPYRRIATIAGRQRGLITHRQLLELAIPRRTIADAVARRRLHPYRHKGVYPDPVQLTVVAVDTGRRRRGLEVHRVGSMPRPEARRCRGLPVVAPARALLDVAPPVSGRQLELALDTALARQITSLTAIRETLARHPRRAGAARLRALLDPERPSSMTESPGQERLLALIRRSGVPAPETEQWIGRYRADLMWRDARLVVEFDGRGWHGSRHRFETDRARDNWLSNHGWRVIRVTSRQLEGEPERVLVWIATELGRAAR